jgi:hypothetical protein
VKIEISKVKPGMRVWSDLLDEYFTVQSVLHKDGRTTLYDGIFAMRGLDSSEVETLP